MDEKKYIKEVDDLTNRINYLCANQPVQIITHAISKFWAFYIKTAPPEKRLPATVKFMALISTAIIINPEEMSDEKALDEVNKFQDELDKLFNRLLDEQKDAPGDGKNDRSREADNKMTKEKLICKCCGKPARWCGEGENACGEPKCDHIHCDHCGMHYSLESEASHKAETFEEMRELMLKAY